MMIKNIQEADKKMNKFNMSRKGCEIYELADYTAKILKVGVNIGSRGTQSASQTKQRVKWINQAIKLSEEINNSKLRKK